jgi:hypothetical protein
VSKEGAKIATRVIPRLSSSFRQARLWLLSAVLVGLLPVLAALIYDLDHGKVVDIKAILASGDALVLSAALAGSCVYDLMNKTVSEEQGDTKNVVVILAFVQGMCAAVWFADIRSTGPANATGVSLFTLWYLCGTIVVCLRGLSIKDSRKVP